MTTCFSHFVRGDFVAAARANPAGLMLAMLCVVMIPWSLLSAARGYLWLIDEPVQLLIALITIIAAVAMLSWFIAIWRNV
jgi:hypothetical protein